jgi:hypothetical protein
LDKEVKNIYGARSDTSKHASTHDIDRDATFSKMP